MLVWCSQTNKKFNQKKMFLVLEIVHKEILKNNFSILGEGLTDNINDRVAELKKSLILILLIQKRISFKFTLQW